MGWEIKNNQFFCNTSDTFFGPYLEDWPDHDSWYKDDRDDMFHQAFNKFLQDNPLKQKGRGAVTDPRAMKDGYLEKIVGQFEVYWSSINCAAETLESFAKDNQLNAVNVLSSLVDEVDFVPKKKVPKKKVPKKKPTRNKATRKKAVKKKRTVSSR